MLNLDSLSKHIDCKVQTGSAASTNAGPTGAVAVLPQGASSEQNSSSS